MLSCAQHFQSLLDGINIPEKNCTSTWQRDENRDHLSLLKVSSHSRVARILFRYIRLINILNAFDKSDLGDMVCSSLRVYFHLICLYSKAPSLCTCVSPWIRGGHTAGIQYTFVCWRNTYDQTQPLINTDTIPDDIRSGNFMKIGHHQLPQWSASTQLKITVMDNCPGFSKKKKSQSH